MSANTKLRSLILGIIRRFVGKRSTDNIVNTFELNKAKLIDKATSDLQERTEVLTDYSDHLKDIIADAQSDLARAHLERGNASVHLVRLSKLAEGE